MEKFKITINDEEFEIAGQFPTGSDLKHFAKVPQSYGIWIKSVNWRDEDKELSHNEKVDVMQPGRNCFYTGYKQTIEG